MSAPSTSTALTFAAFTPKVHQSILSLGHNGAAIAEGAMAMKYRPEDELEVEINNLGLSAANGAVIGFDTASGFYPGLITLHQYNTTTAKNVPVEFGTCHINFSTSASALGPGLPHVAARQKAANSDTRLTVTNGIVAKVGCITNLVGRVTKDGAGSLEIGLFGPESRNTGTLAVEAGTLSVTSDAGLEPACVGTLAISNGATFRLPEQGLQADRLVFEPGAKIVGPGVLQLKGTHRLQGLVIADDVRIVLSDIEVEQPGSPDTVPGNPAFWVDCSKLTTLVYENVDGTNFVSRINDVRKTSDEDAYLFSTNCSGPASPWKPYLVDTAYRGNHLVCFEGSYTPATYTTDGKAPPKTPDDSDTHAWSRPVHNIRAVFQVLIPFGKQNCGFLGATSAARLTEPNHQTHSGQEFARYNSNYTGDLFSWVGGSPAKVPAVANGQILVNGRETAIADGYPYKPYVPYAGGATRYVPCVMSVVMDQTAAWFPAADSYDFSPTYANQNKSGGKAMGELLVYTNELTAAQCRQVTAYLLKKWLGQGYDNDAITQTDGRTLGVLEAGLTASIGIASGASAIADSLSGAGTFSKNGEGSLFVTAMANAADASIEVNGGTLTIPSVSCTAASLVPTNAYRWYDASDPTAFTYTVDGNGVTNISAWADVRGTSGYAATIKSASSTNRPTLRSFAALGGKTAVDFGEVRRWDKAKETDWTAAPSLEFTNSGIELYTVIAVWGSGHGGGNLVGSTASSHYWDSDYTLARDGDKSELIGSTASASIFRTMLHPYVSAFNGKAELNKRAGQFKLNGEAKNPWATGLSGSFDIVSFTDIEPFGATAFSAVCAEPQWVGGEQFAEYLLYKRGLTRSEVAGVEAYLRKKWFNQDTPGYTSGGTEVSSVTVAAGATLRVVGGEPIRVASLSGAGTVDGKIALAEGASFEVVVDAEGACSKISVGELAVPAVATVRFVGNVRKVTPGSYVILESPTVSAGAVAGWTVTGLPSSRICTLRATDGAIVADISKSGMTVIVQ